MKIDEMKETSGRSPHGERGLKYAVFSERTRTPGAVAPLTGSVD